MPDNACESQITDYRKAKVVVGLAAGKMQTHIARELCVNVRTVRRWIADDPQLAEAIQEAKQDLRMRLEDRQAQIALGTIKSTPEVSYRALCRILDRMDEDERRSSGEVTMNGARMVLMEMCKAVHDMPEARARIREVYERSRREQEERQKRLSDGRD